MTPRRIEVRIDALVLHGFAPADRQRIGAALEGELARLLAERGLPEGVLGHAERPVIDAGSFAHVRPATPLSVGGEVARTVYEGLAGAISMPGSGR